jgi:hypothetical protein
MTVGVILLFLGGLMLQGKVDDLEKRIEELEERLDI